MSAHSTSSHSAFSGSMDTFSFRFFHHSARGIIYDLGERKVAAAGWLFIKCTYYEYGDQTNDNKC